MYISVYTYIDDSNTYRYKYIYRITCRSMFRYLCRHIHVHIDRYKYSTQR